MRPVSTIRPNVTIREDERLVYRSTRLFEIPFGHIERGEQGQRMEEERGGERVRQGGRYTTQREDRRYIYVCKVYVYVRNCLPVRSLSPLGEVGRPLGEQSRPTASSRATCLVRTSSPVSPPSVDIAASHR